MTTTRKVYPLLAVAVSMAMSGQVNAQRTTSAQIEEVVVTAQKREENMQDVAISMSAMDANMIQKTFSRTIDEITGMSPNLVINPILGNGTVGVSIRGMQHAEVEKSFDPAVAIYQDGVYLAATTGVVAQRVGCRARRSVARPTGNTVWPQYDRWPGARDSL